MAKTAAIIGGGVIGGGWLARFVLNGWNVRVFDPDPEAERKINGVLDQARHALLRRAPQWRRQWRRQWPARRGAASRLSVREQGAARA